MRPALGCTRLGDSILGRSGLCALRSVYLTRKTLRSMPVRRRVPFPISSGILSVALGVAPARAAALACSSMSCRLGAGVRHVEVDASTGAARPRGAWA